MALPPPDHPHPPRRRRSLLAVLRANFLTGLIVIAPIGLTMWLIWKVIGWIDGWVLPFVPTQFQPDSLLRGLLPDSTFSVRGFGVIIFLIFTVLVGWLAKGLIGRSFLRFGESLVERMPVVRAIYAGLKQITETVFAQSESSFDRACLIEYPRPGLWALAFVSTEAKHEVKAKLPVDGRILSVFLPTTPNPTSGFLLYVPESSVIYLDMSVEDAAKLVISAGLVYPAPKSASKPGPADKPELLTKSAT
jgi:uncharacterized membrane protein